jgi:hypothetical protein
VTKGLCTAKVPGTSENMLNSLFDTVLQIVVPLA